jgi:hypothetical protein
MRTGMTLNEARHKNRWKKLRKSSMLPKKVIPPCYRMVSGNIEILRKLQARSRKRRDRLAEVLGVSSGRRIGVVSVIIYRGHCCFVFTAERLGTCDVRIPQGPIFVHFSSGNLHLSSGVRCKGFQIRQNYVQKYCGRSLSAQRKVCVSQSQEIDLKN